MPELTKENNKVLKLIGDRVLLYLQNLPTGKRPVIREGVVNFHNNRIKSEIINGLEEKLDISGLKFAGSSISLDDLAGLIKESNYQRLSAGKNNDSRRIKPAHPKPFYEMSDAQKGMYFLDKLNPASTFYNVSRLLTVNRTLDMDKMKKAVSTLAARHEILRTNFREKEGRGVQYVRPAGELNHLRLIDLSGLKREEKKEKINSIINERNDKFFNLSFDPLFTLTIIRKSDKEYLFLFLLHHIICDPESFSIIEEELFDIYEGLDGGGEGDIPGEPVQYKDYAEWENSPEHYNKIKKQEKYWLKKLSDPPSFRFPEFVVRDRKTDKSAQDGFIFDKAASGRIKDLCGQRGITPATFFLAALKVMLFRLFEQEDVVVATTVSRRGRSELENAVGLYLNTICFRTGVKAEVKFAEFLKTVHRETIESYENKDYPFNELIKKINPARSGLSPLEAVVFQYFPGESRAVPGGKSGSVAAKDLLSKNSKHHFIMKILARADGEWGAAIEYARDLFTADIINTFLVVYRELVLDILDSPEKKIGDLRIMNALENDRIFKFGLGQKVPYPKNKSITGLLTPVMRGSAGRTALVYKNRQLSYGELNERSNKLARHLSAIGVKRGDVVAFLLNRGPEQIIALLAALRAGAAYLAVNPEYPLQRILYILNDSKAAAVITSDELIGDYDYNIPFAELQKISGRKTEVIKTPPRAQIKDLDSLPIPDRSYFNFNRYWKSIQYGDVANIIPLYTTRGCPFNCAYCHKLWPKTHVFRSAGNIFKEIEIYYRMGIRRFAIIDDIFNLNIKNGLDLFALIRKNKYKIDIFFPNGLRGDILTREYIDRAVEAGTKSITLALETASPRLQKLIRKNLNLERFHENLSYIASEYPRVILNMFTMIGFPTETREEAEMNLEYIKNTRWLDFPYVHILKIFPHTDMERIAVENGVDKQAIILSENLPYHKLGHTLPHPAKYVVNYQRRFVKEYILDKERLMAVLPREAAVMTEAEVLHKYNSFFPFNAKDRRELFRGLGLKEDALQNLKFASENKYSVNDFNQQVKGYFQAGKAGKDAVKILFIDLTMFFFTSEVQQKEYGETPIGLSYLMTYLEKKLGDKITGRIVKSNIDFKSYEALLTVVRQYKPDVIGIRSMSTFKHLCHKAVSVLRQAGVDRPIIVGGPYATSSYDEMLKDGNIDLAVVGEGELTFCEFMVKFIESKNKMPKPAVLEKIPGLAFARRAKSRQVVLIDGQSRTIDRHSGDDPGVVPRAHDPAYIIYTSGSTGKPKGVVVEHRSIVNLIYSSRHLFDFGPSDVWTMFHSCDFDFSVWEIFGCLFTKGKLVIVPEESRKDPARLATLLAKNRISVLNMVPGVFSYFQEKLTHDKFTRKLKRHLKYLIFGGEATTPSDLKVFSAAYPDTKMVNMYGLTENTVHSTFKFLDNDYFDAGKNNVGRPWPNTQAWVLDPGLRPLPVNIPGEICVSGDNLARGYLSDKLKTKQSFLPHPFFKDKIIYKTGDRGLVNAAGEIEAAGRRDFQVKIRGFRVELGEIESLAGRVRGVDRAAVVYRPDVKSAPFHLFYTSRSGQNIPENIFRLYLKRSLPDFMVPGRYIRLDRFKLTASGKIDRNKLPEPAEPAKDPARKNFRTDIEKKLADIWKEVLGFSQVNREHNFFDLGGHSLNAINAINAINKKFNTNFPLKVFFNDPVLKKIAAEIDKLAVNTSGKKAEITAAEADYFPLTANQEMFYQASAGLPPNYFNINVVYFVPEKVDFDLLKKCVLEIHQRHESLRVAFVKRRGGVRQIIQEDSAPGIYYESMGPGSERQSIARLIGKYNYPFDLTKAPLYRIVFLNVNNQKSAGIIIGHHLIADPLSLRVVYSEYNKLYEYYRGIQKEYPLLPNDFNYKRYLNEYKQKDLKPQLKYWLDKFSIRVPSVRIDPGLITDNIEQKTIPTRVAIPDFYPDKLDDFCAKHNLTSYMFFLALLFMFIYKITGKKRSLVGSMMSTREGKEMEKAVGLFVNSLGLDGRVCPGESASDLARRVKQTVLKAMENKDVGFEYLANKYKLPMPAMHSVPNIFYEIEHFSSNNFSRRPGNNIDLKYKVMFTPFDFQQFVNVYDNKYIALEFVFNSRLFNAKTAGKMMNYYKFLLKEVLDDPQKPIKELL